MFSYINTKENKTDWEQDHQHGRPITNSHVELSKEHSIELTEERILRSCK